VRNTEAEDTAQLAALIKKRGSFSGFHSGLFLLFIFILIFLLIFSCVSSPLGGVSGRYSSPETVQPNWQPFAFDENGSYIIGLEYFSGKISSPKIEFHSLRIDLSKPELQIVTSGGKNGNLSAKTSTFVRDNNLLAGINALPFEPVSRKEGEPRTNVGLVISNGIMVSPPHPEFDALVFFADNTAAIVSQSQINSLENIKNAAGGFRRILEDKKPVSRVINLNARHPRSAAGLGENGKILYLLVIDGRRPGSIGATEAETALLLHSLGASDGINFDGGGSSSMALRYPDNKVRVINTPIHGNIPGRERAVAGCLGVGLVQKKN